MEAELGKEKKWIQGAVAGGIPACPCVEGKPENKPHHSLFSKQSCCAFTLLPSVINYSLPHETNFLPWPSKVAPDAQEMPLKMVAEARLQKHSVQVLGWGLRTCQGQLRRSSKNTDASAEKPV